LGQSYSTDLAKEAARSIHDVVDPESDVHVTAEYRRSVVEVLTVRALDDAFRRAKSASDGSSGAD
jgi:CO/xanthine dehydrogenase FAD-binding subunit